MPYLCIANKKNLHSECSAVGSALRSGRRGRAFESPHSDKYGSRFTSVAVFLFAGLLILMNFLLLFCCTVDYLYLCKRMDERVEGH